MSAPGGYHGGGGGGGYTGGGGGKYAVGGGGGGSICAGTLNDSEPDNRTGDGSVRITW